MASASAVALLGSLLMATPVAAQAARAVQPPATEGTDIDDCRPESARAQCRDADGRLVRPQRQARPVETQPATNQLGGGDPGWEDRIETNQLGGGDPGWEERVETNQLGGGDPGWEERVETNELGGGDPGWEERVETNELGGGDPGWEERVETNELGGGDPGWESRIRQSAVPAQTTEPVVKPQGSRN